ncbi:MAG: NYN domain-containing protein [bacterium]
MNVICYVDGFNLYYGLRSSGFRRYYWLDLWALAERFLKENQTLVEVVYCTTKVKQDRPAQRRQLTYIDALQARRPCMKVVYGHYLAKKMTCFECGHSYRLHEEKMTDVNIACHLLTDAMDDRFDVALVMSGDSDLVPPVRIVRKRWPQKRVIAVFPPKRRSDALKRAADGHTWIGQDKLRKSMLPEYVEVAAGKTLKRPETWK